MKTKSLLISFFLLWTNIGIAQSPYRGVVPDIRYPVCGQKRPSSLSKDNVLYTILYFGYVDTPQEGQSGLDANPEYFALTFSDILRPYFNNFNPDYGRALMIISTMKNQDRIEKKINVISYPDIVLVDSKRRIIARSNKASDIIDYISGNLSMISSTDWNDYILKALRLFQSGHKGNARRIVSECIQHGRWYDDFTTEAHKAIPLIVASMRHDEWYMDFVGEIKYRYNIGILSDEDVAPFWDEFKRIHVTGDKDD